MDGMKCPGLEKIDVAKQMAAKKDYVGARSKLLEVHCQFPNLYNLPEMITTCDVLSAGELTLSDGEMDWYWVLQLSPVASVSKIRLQHKKIVAMLEGIKDNFPGTGAALKLVNDAFSVLSNPPKCLVFNSKRLTSWSNFEPFDSPASSVDNAESQSSESLIRGLNTSLGCVNSKLNNTDIATISGAPGESSSKFLELEVPDKFSQDQEVLASVDGTLSALDMNQQIEGVGPLQVDSISFSMKPIPDGKVQSPESCLASTMQHGLSTDELLPLSSPTSVHGRNGYFYDVYGNKKPKIFEVGEIWAVYDNDNLPRRYAHVNSISNSPFRIDITWLQPVPETENEGKWCQAGLPVVCGLFNLQGKEELVVDSSVFSHLVTHTANPTYEEFRIYPQEDEIWAIYKDWRPFDWIENPGCRKECALQIIQIVGAREEECVLVVKPVKADILQSICREDTEQTEETFEILQSCFYRFSHCLPSHEPLTSCSNSVSQSFHSFPVADSKGSLLKVEWRPDEFTSGQVWAIYDGPDQMPRRYAVVNNASSNKLVGVTLLEPHPMCEEEIRWNEKNLLPGCGTFKVGRAVVTLHVSKFAHRVACDRSTKQMFYRIYPNKGEVWAMYRNWNSNWKRRNFANSGFRIVQIVSDFCEQSGVHVFSLEEVPGYKTFFQKQLCDGFALNRAVRRSEMLSFSHRIEAFIVPGIQAHGIPECSWHLEPDALPRVLTN